MLHLLCKPQVFLRHVHTQYLQFHSLSKSAVHLLAIQKFFASTKNDEVFCNDNKFKFGKALSTSNQRHGMLQRVKKKLYSSVSTKSKVNIGACLAYEAIGDIIDYNEFFNCFKLPDTFQSFFLAMQLHVWMCSVVTISETNGRLYRNQLIESMWVDVEARLKNLKEIRSSLRKEYLAEMEDQFQAALVAYDEGLLSNDTVLAGAAWRTMFGFRSVDPRLLEALTLYIRKQIDHLDSLHTEDLMFRGSISFLPLKDIVHHLELQ